MACRSAGHLTPRIPPTQGVLVVDDPDQRRYIEAPLRYFERCDPPPGGADLVIDNS